MNLKTFGIASIVLLLAACSTQPQQRASGSASAPAVAAPAAATATATPVAAAPATALAQPAQAAPAAGQAAAAPAAPQISRALLSAGYKPTTIKGEVYYCRKEAVTNTAFKKTVCLNETQLKDEERRIKEMQREMIRSQPNPSCMGPTCGG